MKSMNKQALIDLIKNALHEDIQTGDHSSNSCIPANEIGQAKLLVKQNGIVAGVEVAKTIFEIYDSSAQLDIKIEDGQEIKTGDVVFTVKGKVRTILACERLVLNCMQRMSGIATYTHFLNQKISGTNAKLLDTRKTTPNFRLLEKEAVKIGGGTNHRFGLYDMIMLKDNHIDYAGGIKNAIQKTKTYLNTNQLFLDIEVEVRNFDELNQVLIEGGIQRIMLDNFTPIDLEKAIKIIKGKYPTEASGGITEETILDYALTGVNFISVGALTHQVKSLDLSLKAF